MAGSAAANARSSSLPSVRTDRRGAFAPVRIIAFLILLASAMLAGWMVIKVTAANLFNKDRFLAAAPLAADDPQARLSTALARLMAGRGRVTPELMAEVRDAAKAAPLADEPFLIAGIEAIARGDSARGERLLEEARERSPRSRMTRLILLDRYLRAGRIDEAGTEIAVLVELVPAAEKLLVAELARLSLDPGTRATLRPILASRPALLQQVLDQLAANPANADVTLDLWRSAGRPALPQNARWQEALVQGLVSRGQVGRARSIWAQFAPGAQEGGFIYDPTFRNLTAPPPFGWKLSEGGGGVAEPSQNGALQIDYYGREDADLATQLLTLPPGRYRLSVMAEGEPAGEGSRLLWGVGCTGAKTQLAALRLDELAYEPRRLTADFQVPTAGCAGQILALKGVASEFPKGRTATLRELRIDRVQG